MLHFLLTLGAAGTAASAPTFVQVSGYVPATCRVSAASEDLLAPDSSTCTLTATTSLAADAQGTTLIRVTVTPR
jgi:hypothetical protein